MGKKLPLPNRQKHLSQNDECSEVEFIRIMKNISLCHNAPPKMEIKMSTSLPAVFLLEIRSGVVSFVYNNLSSSNRAAVPEPKFLVPSIHANKM